ncbi:hypothetical protein ACQKIW_30975 [Bacillus thuringiensis]|uniref:hypothetical protein n=1 Tax=Bacillus thuringiensis TaxID=1428 RepID=UPI003D0374CA
MQTYSITVDSSQSYLLIKWGKEQVIDALYPQIPLDPNLPWPDSGNSFTQIIDDKQSFVNFPIITNKFINKNNWLDYALNIVNGLINLNLTFSCFLYNFDGSLVNRKNDSPLSWSLNLKYPGNNMGIPQGSVLAYYALKNNNHMCKTSIDYPFNGNKLKRDIQYKLLNNTIVPCDTSYRWENYISTGISQNDKQTLATILGIEMNTTEGVIPISESDIKKINEDLNRMFGYSNKISNEESIIHTFDFYMPSIEYNYSFYKCGVYQLNSIFTFIPSSNLKKFKYKIISEVLNNTLDIQFPLTYIYPEKSLFAIQNSNCIPNSTKKQLVQYLIYNNSFKKNTYTDDLYKYDIKIKELNKENKKLEQYKLKYKQLQKLFIEIQDFYTKRVPKGFSKFQQIVGYCKKKVNEKSIVSNNIQFDKKKLTEHEKKGYNIAMKESQKKL